MSKLETREVKYLDIVFVLEGKYFKGTLQTHDTPADPEEFEIHKAFINDVNVTDLLSDNQISELESLALDY
jgi:hypothetical protein